MILPKKINAIIARRYFEKGNRFWQSGHAYKAIKSYKKAINWNTDYSASYHNLAGCFAQSEKWDEAIEAYQHAIKLNPQFSWSHQCLGEILFKFERWEEAVTNFKYSIKLNPQLFEPYPLLGDALFELDKFTDALHIFEKSIKLNPDIWNLYYKRGNTLFRLENWHEAIDAYKHAIKLNPKDSGCYIALGDTYYQLKNFDESIECYHRAIQINPDYPWTYNNLADTYNVLGEYNNAINSYNYFISLNSEYSWSYYNLAECLIYEGAWDKAVDSFQKCKNIDPTLPGLNDKLDEALFLQAQWKTIVDFCSEKNLQENNDKLTDSVDTAPLNILMLTPYPPFPPYTGGAIRMYEQIKYFGSQHKLTVVSFYNSESLEDINNFFEEYCEHIFLVKMGQPKYKNKTSLPYYINRHTTNVMWKTLEKLSENNFDLVLFEFILMAPYQKIFKNTYTILSEHNIESNVIKQNTKDSQVDPEVSTNTQNQADHNNDYESLVRYENETWPSFSLRTTVSEYDKNILSSRTNSGDTILVPNGIDTQNIEPVEYVEEGKILFMGHLSYYPNIEAITYFIKEILPLVWEKNPNLIFCIAGQTPAPAIEKLSDHPKIELVANPENMTEIAQDCSMTVVPVRLGSGTRIKILHSMALGLPVITTELGCQGLDVGNKKHLLIADTPKDFANAVLKIKYNKKLRDKIRAKGRYLVKTEYTWDTIFQNYENEILSRLDKSEIII